MKQFAMRVISCLTIGFCVLFTPQIAVADGHTVVSPSTFNDTDYDGIDITSIHQLDVGALVEGLLPGVGLVRLWVTEEEGQFRILLVPQPPAGVVFYNNTAEACPNAGAGYYETLEGSTTPFYYRFCRSVEAPYDFEVKIDVLVPIGGDFGRLGFVYVYDCDEAEHTEFFNVNHGWTDEEPVGRPEKPLALSA